MWLKILTLIPALWSMVKDIYYFFRPKQKTCIKDDKQV